MVSLICARINGWANSHEACDLRRHRAHYDVTVMKDILHPQFIGPAWVNSTLFTQVTTAKMGAISKSMKMLRQDKMKSMLWH